MRPRKRSYRKAPTAALALALLSSCTRPDVACDPAMDERIDRYAAWIVKNKHLKGTADFETVARAYREAREEEVNCEREDPGINDARDGYYCDVYRC